MDDTKQIIEKAKIWIKDNQSLLRKYKGQWIAYNGDVGIIAHDKSVTKVMEIADNLGVRHIIKYLNPYTYGGLRRLVPIHFGFHTNEIYDS